MKVLAVNIRAGGNASLVRSLVARCLRHEPDAIVLSEFRDNTTGAALRARLSEVGFEHQAASVAGVRANGVLIAAIGPFRATPNPFGLADDEYPHAVLAAQFDWGRVLGVYLPGQDRKRPHLRFLAATAEHDNASGAATLAIGDFNSGRNATDIEMNLRTGRLVDAFSTADLYAELEAHWTEAWLHMHPDDFEFSWYPFRNDPGFVSRDGWRIDKAFVSRALLPRLRSAEYDHIFRSDRLTDHSGLIVEFET